MPGVPIQQDPAALLETREPVLHEVYVGNSTSEGHVQVRAASVANERAKIGSIAFSLAPPRPERVIARIHGAAGPPRRRRRYRGARRVPRRSSASCRCRPAGPRRASGRHGAGVQHQTLRAGALRPQRAESWPAAVGMWCNALLCGFGCRRHAPPGAQPRRSGCGGRSRGRCAPRPPVRAA